MKWKQNVGLVKLDDARVYGALSRGGHLLVSCAYVGIGYVKRIDYFLGETKGKPFALIKVGNIGFPFIGSKFVVVVKEARK